MTPKETTVDPNTCKLLGTRPGVASSGGSAKCGQRGSTWVKLFAFKNPPRSTRFLPNILVSLSVSRSRFLSGPRVRKLVLYKYLDLLEEVIRQGRSGFGCWV